VLSEREKYIIALAYIIFKQRQLNLPPNSCALFSFLHFIFKKNWKAKQQGIYFYGVHPLVNINAQFLSSVKKVGIEYCIIKRPKPSKTISILL
jgi:hypothetical protein